MKMRFVGVFIGMALLLTACAQGDLKSARAAAAQSSLTIVSGETRHQFTVELADNDEERRIGLMYRETMAPDAGMLFNFGEPQPISMWMKNTLIPLDMAFIDKDGVIIRIAENTTPMSLKSIPSGGDALAVLEVNGGTFERLGIKPGDRVQHEMFE